MSYKFASLCFFKGKCFENSIFIAWKHLFGCYQPKSSDITQVCHLFVAAEVWKCLIQSQFHYLQDFFFFDITDSDQGRIIQLVHIHLKLTSNHTAFPAAQTCDNDLTEVH